MENFIANTSPEPISLTGNPIVFAAEYTGSANPSFDFIGIRLHIVSDGESYTFDDMCEYNSSNVFTFDVSSYFNKLIKRSVTIDLGTAGYKIHTDGVASFHVYYGTRNSTTKVWTWESETTPEAELVDSDYYYALNGKLPEYFVDIMNAKATNFYQQFIDAKKFLTWHSDYKTISVNQPERLFFYLAESSSYTALRLRITVVGSEHSQYITVPLSIEINRMYEFAIGLSELTEEYDEETNGYARQINAAIQAEVGGVWEIYSEVRHFYIDGRDHLYNTLIFYGNDLGGSDTLWATGRVIKSGSYEGVKRYRENRYYEGGQTSIRKYKTSTWEIYVGRKSRGDIKSIEQMLFNNQVFMPVNGILIPIDIKNGEVVNEDSQLGFIKVKIDIEMAYLETAYGDPERIEMYDWAEFFNQEFSSEFLI